MQTFLIWGVLAALACSAGFVLARFFVLGRFKGLRFGKPLTYAWTAFACFALGGAMGWLFVPTLHWAFNYVWVSSIAFIGIGVMAARWFKVPPKPKSKDEYVYRDPDYNKVSRGLIWGGSAIAAGLLLFWTFGFVTTSSIFHAPTYRAMLGEPVRVNTFTDDVAPVNTQRLRIVNEAFAQQIADKMLGEQSGLGSQVEVDTMHIAQLNGCFDLTNVSTRQAQQACFEHELVWVAPVVHSGIFRWIKNRHTEQYAIVSASNPTRKFFVNKVGSNELRLRYQLRGAHFGDYLVRHLRENGYLNRGLTDFNFELDDSGRPWWVVVTYEKRVGFSGRDSTGVVVVDPSTGEIQEYGINDVPAWVDRVQPERLILRQFDDWGRFSLGWLNSWFARTDVVQTSTYDLHLVEGTDGRTYWYTGVTSVGSDNSTTGFVLIDTRTKQVRLYTVPGATEEAAQASAMNSPGARERQYTAGEPILYNMGGHPTYFMTLSGTDNLPKMYAFVSVRDFEVVGVAESISAALHRYETAIRGAGRAAVGQTATQPVVRSGVIQRIVRDNDGWAILLMEESGAEYFVPGNVSPETKYTQNGDSVQMTYQVIPNRPDRPVSSFDNTGLQLTQ